LYVAASATENDVKWHQTKMRSDVDRNSSNTIDVLRNVR